MDIVQITTHLPPAISGVGDYAAQIGQTLAARGVRSSFIVANRPSGSAPGTACIEAQSSSAILEALESLLSQQRVDAVLLHLSIYGYQKRGVPLWLLTALRAFRRRRGDVRIVTWFHELYATGAPWRSAFWLSRLQKRILREIASLSDAAITNCQSSAEELREWGAPNARVMPVFSNVGEWRHPSPVSHRPASAVVFGGRATRVLTHRNCAPLIRRLMESGRISELIDIGPGEIGSQTPGVPTRHLGAVPAHAVSEALRSARVGLLFYPHRALAKSSVFAAYAAHGVFPIVAGYDLEIDGLKPGREFVTLGPETNVSWDQVGENVHHWYFRHSRDAHAEALAGLLGNA